MSAGQQPLIYRVNDLELDVARGCVRRNGEEIHLKPKAFQILMHLLTHRDRLVTREELLDEFWKDTAVSDDILAQSIAEVRKALRDSPREPLFLKTIPKRGYRFVAEVQEVWPKVAANEQITTIQIREDYAGERPLPSGRLWLVAAGILGLVVLGGLALWWRAHPGLPAPVGGKRQIAVMRFENHTGQPVLDWLRDGLPDMLTTTLSRSPGLDVLSREQLTVWLGRIGDRGLPGAIELSRRSHAQLAVLGSFTAVGTKIRIDARTYDARKGRLLAADAITVDNAEQILGQVDFLAALIARRLSTRPAGEDQRALASLMTDNLEAYRYYSLGLEQANSFHIREAIQLLEKATALDPNFAMAYGRIGYAYALPGGQPDTARPYLEKAFKMADKLSDKDRRQIVAWYAISNRDYPEAIRRYNDLVREYPNEAESHRRLANLLRGESRHEEAVDVLRQGLAIDPEDPNMYNSLSAVYSEMGNHEEAIRMAERFVALQPNTNAYDTLGLACQMAGLFDKALAAFNQALEMESGFEPSALHRANLYMQMGRERDALHESAVGATSGRELYRSRYWGEIAWIQWRQGRIDEMRRAVAKMIRERPPYQPQWSIVELLAAPAHAARTRESVAGRGARFGLREEAFYLAQEARMENRPAEMMAHLRDTLRYRPSWGMTEVLEDVLADAYLDAGRVDEAIVEYQRALKLFPGMPRARYHLAQAYLRKGDRKAAKAQFAQFLEMWKQADPDLPEMVEARRRVL